LNFDDTENTVGVTSGTSVALVDFGTINLATDNLDLSEGPITNVSDIAVNSISDNDNDGFTIGSAGSTVTVESVVFTGGAITGVTDITVSNDVLLSDGAVVGITGNEIITFNAAGTIVASGGIFSSTGGEAVQTPLAGATADFAANFTGAYLYGGTYVATSDSGDAQLPLMAAGMNFCIITEGAIQVVVASHANDGYLLDGTTTAEDNSIVNTSTAGDIACFQYYTADDWLITTNGWATE